MHSIKEVDEDASNKKISSQKDEDLAYTLKIEIDTTTDSIMIAGTKILLNIVSITL